MSTTLVKPGKIDIVIPTLDRRLGNMTGNLAIKCSGLNDVELVVVHDAKRERFTKTVNRGLRERRQGSHVCILNDDVYRFQLGWLQILYEKLTRLGAGAVCPTGQSHTAPMSKAHFVGIGTKQVKSIPFWCVLISNTALNKVGLLDERFIHYSSDNDWCRRASKVHIKLMWVKEVYLWHKTHGSGRLTKLAKVDAKRYKRKWS